MCCWYEQADQENKNGRSAVFLFADFCLHVKRWLSNQDGQDLPIIAAELVRPWMLR